MRKFKYLILILIIFYVAIFTKYNDQGITIYYWPGKPLLGVKEIKKDEITGKIESFEPKTLPVFAIVFASVIIGFIISWLLSLLQIASLKSDLKKANREISILTKELSEIKTAVSSLEEQNQSAQISQHSLTNEQTSIENTEQK